MKRLRIFILVFGITLTIPITYFVYHSYQGLENEELEELRFFSETLFNQMEDEMESFVRREESRAIDEYSSVLIAGSGFEDTQSNKNQSQFSKLPSQRYILGYLQNSPDGSLQSPLQQETVKSGSQEENVISELKRLNSLFNTKRISVSLPDTAKQPTPVTKTKEPSSTSKLTTRYLHIDRLNKQKTSLGQEKKRVEEITITQARNIAQAPVDDNDQWYAARKGANVASPRNILAESAASDHDAALEVVGDSKRKQEENKEQLFAERPAAVAKTDSIDAREGRPELELSAGKKENRILLPSTLKQKTFQVEVDPLQSVQLDAQHVFLFRRIALNNRIYRQGLILKTEEFLQHLGQKYFSGQPLASFTNLRFSISGSKGVANVLSLGADVRKAKFELTRTFPRPFSFIDVRLTCETIPKSNSRQTLIIMMSVLIVVICLGLFSIYQSARIQVDLSRRRNGFVSSVTHELKTPLTNIRMYIEMLEQGIAHDTDREKEYFRILGSESARLTRLINNILEFSKLENKQRHLALTQGTLDEVLEEVKDVMKVKLQQEGFAFTVRKEPVPMFQYDKEAMVQILINLIDNSIKFGEKAEEKAITLHIHRKGNSIQISVSDTGSGLPEDSLNKIFDDFYRADNSLTRKTSGTGIGLALVKKFVLAMGGTVAAVNNSGSGCTVTVSLPLKH